MIEQFIQPTPWIIGYTIILLIASIAIGFYARKYAKNAEQFFGGTKNFSGIIVGLASMATVIGIFAFIGGPGLVYECGMSSIWMAIACGPSFAFCYWVIGKRIRGMAEVTDVATLADIAYVRFESQSVRGILALALILGAFACLSSQVKISALLMNQMLGISEEWGVAIIFAIMIASVSFSGMPGSIMTGAFQALVMLIAVIAAIIGFFILTGGDLTPIQNSPNFGPAFVDGFGTMPLQILLVYSLVFFVGTLGQPALLTKMYALKTHRDLPKAVITGCVACVLISLIWILCGYGALYIVASGGAPYLVKFDNATFLFVSKLNAFTQSLIMVGLLAAILSAGSFFISLAGSAIVRDLFGALGNRIIPRRQIFYGRILQVIIPCVAIGFTYWGGRTVDVLATLGWGFFASVMMPTFTIGLLWKRCSTEGILTGLWFAVISNIAFPMLKNFKFFKLPFPYYFFCITGAVLLTIIVSFYTKTCSGDNLPKAIKPIFKL